MSQINETSLILVAVMPNRKDLEIARLLGWYRVPLRMAPKIIDVDYLVFYQTSQFGPEHRWKIEYIAPVRGHELATRGELLRDEPDHPRAKEEYYKIQIGELEKLAKPIQTEKWKRVTFFYTLGSLFINAETLNELIVHSDERETLWQSLRERQKIDYALPSDELSSNLPTEEIIAMLMGLENTQLDSDFQDI